jgi:hypothetical protein
VSDASGSPLPAALDAVWAAALTLPDDEAAFAGLDPAARRAAHDVGVRCVDRLSRVLARLVEDMAEDGADLVDDDGLPAAMRRATS